MKIQWDNLIDKNGTVLTCASMNGNYPVNKLKNYHLVDSYRTLSISNQWIAIDASPLPADSIAIMGHNMTTSATVVLQGNDTNSWTTPEFATSLTVTANNMTGYFTEKTYQYWRLTFTDPTNTEDYIEMGRLFLGKALTVTRSFKNEFSQEQKDTSEQLSSVTGQVYGVKGMRWKQYNLTFPYWTETVKNNIETMIASVRNYTPIVVDLNETDKNSFPSLYCTVDANTSYSHVINEKFTGSLNLKETF